MLGDRGARTELCRWWVIRRRSGNIGMRFRRLFVLSNALPIWLDPEAPLNPRPTFQKKKKMVKNRENTNTRLLSSCDILKKPPRQAIHPLSRSHLLFANRPICSKYATEKMPQQPLSNSVFAAAKNCDTVDTKSHAANPWWLRLLDDIDLIWADVPILACSLVSGLVDSVAFNAGSVFVSMQTGTTDNMGRKLRC